MEAKPKYNKGAYDGRNEEFYGSQGKYGIMYAGDYKWDNVECTKRAYGVDREGRSVAFHTPLLSKEEALKCIRVIPKYNAFDPDAVAAQLAEMPEETEIVVGREGSPVLYVWTEKPGLLEYLFGELKNMGSGDGWISGPDEWSEVSSENRDFSKFHIPEDADGDKVLIRAWWD